MTRVWLLALALVGCDRGASEGADAGSPPPFGVASLVAHNESTFALMNDGTVRAWGANGAGQLGPALPLNRDSATPVEVKGIRGATALWAGGSGVAVTACAQGEGGKVWCWGHADLIPGATAHKGEPFEVPALAGAKSLSLGGGHACMVTARGGVKCWGWGGFGALGLGKETRAKRIKRPKRVPGLNHVVDVVCGNNHSCALHKDGGVSCWGHNRHGQSDPESRGHVEVYKPRRVDSVGGAKALALSHDQSCVLDAGGTVSCWGKGFPGKTVAPLLDGEGVSGLWRGFGATPCFVRGGEAWCWGANDAGQVGVAPRGKDVAMGVSPRKVEGLTNLVATSTAASSRHNCFASAAAVHCFGRNRFGALGDGTVVDRHALRPVSGLLARPLASSSTGFATAVESGAPWSPPAELPEGCVGKPTLRIKLEGDARERTVPIRFASARSTKREGNDKTRRVQVDLRTYAPPRAGDGRVARAQPRGDQIALRLDLRRERLSGEDEERQRTPLPLVIGPYSVGRQRAGERAVVVADATRRRDRFFFARESGAKSYVGAKVTHLGDAWVCGELSLANEKGEVSGTFVAPLVVK